MNNEKDNYCIKKGYKSQEHSFTLSQKDSGLYWTEERILISLRTYAQYDVYKFARKIIKRHDIKNVIDVGCGIGFKPMELIYPVCKDITGVDQKEAIEYCRQSYKSGNFIVDDFENPSTEPGVFDLVICADVIEHLLNPDKLLEYIKTVSHKGSFIIFSTPERDIVRGKDCMGSNKPEHVREWNREEFAAYLEDRGFKILEHKLFPHAKFSLGTKICKVLKSTITRKGTKADQVVLCQVV